MPGHAPLRAGSDERPNLVLGEHLRWQDLPASRMRCKLGPNFNGAALPCPGIELDHSLEVADIELDVLP